MARAEEMGVRCLLGKKNTGKLCFEGGRTVFRAPIKVIQTQPFNFVFETSFDTATRFASGSVCHMFYKSLEALISVLYHLLFNNSFYHDLCKCINSLLSFVYIIIWSEGE